MFKHGQSNTRLHSIWVMMRQRCYNINNKDYCNYGARGIQVCQEWRKDFEGFNEWAYNNGYESNLSLDRVDVNSNYQPDNCRWATIEEQANNKRNTIYIDINGESLTITEIAKIYSLPRATIEMRYARGDRGERLIRQVRKRTA